jgi:hypothetical protein
VYLSELWSRAVLKGFGRSELTSKHETVDLEIVKAHTDTHTHTTTIEKKKKRRRWFYKTDRASTVFKCVCICMHVSVDLCCAASHTPECSTESIERENTKRKIERR